jgi:hypothetical protein
MFTHHRRRALDFEIWSLDQDKAGAGTNQVIVC